MTDKKNLGKWLNQIGNFADTAKQAIKQGNNDVALNVMKTGFNELEYITDFFYVNMYLNKTSILYQNFEIFKYIIENNKINVKDNPTVNSSLVKSDYKRKSSEVIKELKDHYIDLEMPYVMIAAVGGSVKILESLLSKGADVNSSGYVSLSRKKKNAFISNALGAAAYFGNLDMVKYLIETKPSIDLNFKTIEKSSKVKSSVFSRDFSHTTPLTLAISGENDESDCINIVRLLIKQSKIEKDCYDHERNSPLHLAVKYNKMEVVKFFVNEVKYSLEERNVDGYSPFSFAQQNNNSEMINYLKQFEKTTPNIDELLESIQTDKKTKTKGKKTKKHKEIGILLGSSDYQDSVKTKTVVQTLSLKPIPMSEDKEINVQKIAPIDIISKTDPSTIEHKIINIDKEEYEAYKLKEKHSKERKQLLLLQEQQKKISESEKVKQPKAEKKEIKGNKKLIKNLLSLMKL